MFRAIRKIPSVRRLYYTWNAPVKLVRFRPDLKSAVTKNRETLSLVPRWLDDSVYQASIFQYGLPPHIRDFIDDRIDDSPTYTDLLVHLASGFPNLRYLEFGPSVGKNVFQVAKAVSGAEITAVDIENINPILEEQFAKNGQESWETKAGSKRKALSTQTSYVLESNKFDYIAGDLFDNATWARLKGKKFNLVFSDAFHSPEALLMEWQNISALELLANGRFAFVWDDLTTDGMRKAFFKIASEIKKQRPKALVSLELLQGWVGKREDLHPIGIVRDPG